MASEFCGLCHSVWDTASGDVVAIVCSNKACGSTAYCGDCLRTLYLCTPGGKLAYVPDRRYTEATKGLKDYKLESVACPHDVEQVTSP
jgi:hypothetical protein